MWVGRWAGGQFIIHYSLWDFQNFRGKFTGKNVAKISEQLVKRAF